MNQNEGAALPAARRSACANKNARHEAGRFFIGSEMESSACDQENLSLPFITLLWPGKEQKKE